MHLIQPPICKETSQALEVRKDVQDLSPASKSLYFNVFIVSALFNTDILIARGKPPV